MPPPKVYPEGEDEFLLAIQFPDGKTGYVNVTGCCGLKENLYQGSRDASKEYVSLEHPDLIFAREANAKAKKDKIDEEEKRKKEKDRLALNRDKEERSRKAQEALRSRAALPSPKLGMTQQQIVDQSNWGRPIDINRTITATGTREQWVYGNRRYLYFQNGVLTAIQD